MDNCTFLGYKREDGSAGVRNKLAIFSASACANKVVFEISKQLDNSIPLTHYHACGPTSGLNSELLPVMVGIGKNPNFGAVLIVALGCECIDFKKLYEEISSSGKPAELLVVQEIGDTLETIKKGVEGISRNPLARKAIFLAMLWNLVGIVIITLVGLALSVFVILY